MSKRYQQGDIINGYAITGEPERNPSNKKVRYPFACSDCGKEIGSQETGNVKRRSTCTCKMGQPDPGNSHKFIKEEEGCSSICHTGVTEYWHKLTNEDGLSQRKAAEHIHSLIMSNTNEGETLEKEYSAEKIRSIARSGTGKKKSEKPEKKEPEHQQTSASSPPHSSPNQLINAFRQHRQGIEGILSTIQGLVTNNKIHDGSTYKPLDNEVRALRNMADMFLNGEGLR